MGAVANACETSIDAFRVSVLSLGAGFGRYFPGSLLLNSDLSCRGSLDARLFRTVFQLILVQSMSSPRDLQASRMMNATF